VSLNLARSWVVVLIDYITETAEFAVNCDKTAALDARTILDLPFHCLSHVRSDCYDPLS
jgi:hypothetical protein